jgi:general secretion pathway protein G
MLEEERTGAPTWAKLLIALAVVLVVVGCCGGGVLAAGVFAAKITVDQQLQAAQLQVARIQVEKIYERGQIYHIRHGAMPASVDEIYAPEPAPLDPWGNAHVLRAEGEGFTIVSYGADGIEGGRGNDADITVGY